jgi:para-nitrobenzyl esterase
MTEATAVRADDRRAVDTAAGWVVGERTGAVTRFLGIPYATVTARFRAPSPVPPWNGARLALDYGPACPQPPIRENLVIDPEVERAMFGLSDEPQSERGCLSLNVWTPATGDGGDRPVLVSLHGGGFKSGSGSARSAPWFDGARLSQRGDAVVVTVNHRIGVLGHLQIEGLQGSGNAGLLDLVAVLEWVRDNAGCFGGDPGRVTIFGESGGGGKVMTLMTMPSAAGLFARAICQSGTLAWLSEAEAASVTREVMEHLHVRSAEELMSIDVGALVSAGAAVTRSGMRFGPVIDGATLPSDAIEALRAGASAEVPLIIGVTRDEATAFLGPSVGDPELVRGKTDEMFRGPALQAASAKARRGGAPAFVYEFAWETPVMNGSLGAAHGVDVAFPFDNTDLHPATTGSASARHLAPVVSDAWLAFARDGDPNHAGLPEWPPFDPADGATLIFDQDCRVERRSITAAAD